MERRSEPNCNFDEVGMADSILPQQLNDSHSILVSKRVINLMNNTSVTANRNLVEMKLFDKNTDEPLVLRKY